LSSTLPPFVRHLAGFFIGFPGCVFWVGGWIGSIIHGTIFFSTGGIETGWVVSAAVALGLALLGYAMIVAFELLVVGQRYRIATRHLAPCLGLELGIQFLFALAMAFVWGGILGAFAGGTWSVILLELLFISAAITTTHVFNLLKIKREKWEREALTDERLVD
jgi:hypothetical protein